MKNNEKYDFIKEKLNDEQEELPSSLKKENIVSSLECVSQPQKVKSFTPKKTFALAASLAIVVLSVIMLSLKGSVTPPVKGGTVIDENNTDITETINETKTETENTESYLLLTKEEKREYEDIIKFFSSRWSDRKNFDISIKGEVEEFNYAGEAITAAPAAPDASPTTVHAEQNSSVAPGSSLNSANGSFGSQNSKTDTVTFGQTNTQVENVDEADIIKNDGEYLYIVLDGSVKSSVMIYRASDLKLVGKISLESKEDTELRISDIYVRNNRLVIMTEESERRYGVYNGYCYSSCYFRGGDAMTKCFVYDISSREEPKEVFTHTQSGSLSVSRLVGDTLYTVSLFNVYQKQDEKLDEFKSRCIPKVDGKKIPRSKIDFKNSDDEPGYVVVSSCDISLSSADGTAYAYLGMVSDSYCTENTLYLSYQSWVGEDYDRLVTEIRAFSLSKDDISLTKEGEVEGAFLNQFSMDEYNGYFRCATTNEDENWNDISSVYVLDSDLKVVGKLENLAHNEEIKSVRFMGDTAYVVTFENTDPLFVLDLSDPTNPKKDGEVKLPGFSSYLHPIGENYIVGVGEGGDNNGTDGSFKVTLFDISDKKNPKVVSNYKVKNADTEVSYNAKAFLYYPEKNIIGVPVSKFNSTKNAYTETQGYVLLKVENGKLTLVNNFEHDKFVYNYDVVYEDAYYETNGELTNYYSSFFRGTYIGETLYTASQKKLCSFDIVSGEKLKEAKTGE